MLTGGHEHFGQSARSNRKISKFCRFAHILQSGAHLTGGGGTFGLGRSKTDDNRGIFEFIQAGTERAFYLPKKPSLHGNAFQTGRACA